MKVYKNILTLVILSVLMVSNVFATWASSNMKTAIAEAKYTQQRIKLEKQIDNTFIPQLQKLTSSYKKNLDSIEKGIKRYDIVEAKVDLLISRLKQNNTQQMKVHKPIFLRIKDMVKNEKNILLSEKNILLNKVNIPTSTSQTTTKTQTEIETKLADDLQKWKTYSGLDRNDVIKEMNNSGFSPLESALITWPNFQYCVHFTPDIYKDYWFWYYYNNGQQENTWAIDALDNFLWTKIPLWYDDSTIRWNFNDIQKCVRFFQWRWDYYNTAVTQTYVKELYKKYYDKDLKVWIKPFYNNTTDKMYEILRNPQKYIGDYQWISNYNVRFDRTWGGE